MLKDYTLCENVKKLSPGSILTLDVEEGIISIEQYYQLKNTPYIEDTEENIINELDRRFSNAIKKEYDKDLEYGYKHVATLSGGLDSRTNILKGKMLGYKNILAISFSQSNYLDENIAKNIASDQGFNFLFYALDNGNYLKDIEKPVQANDGQILFWGSAHLLAMISLIDWDELGLLHTGMIGDLILGSYLFDKQHFKVSDKMIQKTAYSNKLINHIPKHIFEEMVQQYESDEMYAFYERCINGVFNGYLMTHHFTEFSSPFLYLDFLEYAMRIHPKIRYKQNIYHKWILTKIPEGSKYIWEKTGLPITAGELRGSLSVLLKQVKRKIYGPQRDSISMNPFNYWYETNSDLRNTFEDYYKQYICLLNNYPSLKEDTRNLFELGDSSEKTQVLTLLAAIKILDLNQNSKN
jgi:asparagine synthase (glutamine-hydrolysing)